MKGVEREGKRIGAQDMSHLEPGYVFTINFFFFPPLLIFI